MINVREEISVKTSKRQEIIDITSAVNDTIKRSGVKRKDVKKAGNHRHNQRCQ
ncbi:hypothetical protein HYT54_01100 [Candidatus Woesearchaeota archaeon]|nr:hypothetical protein [Candidatus Woesearchaeota archaeon]